MEKECEICGVFFQTNRKDRKYCDKCGRKSDVWKMRYERDMNLSRYHHPAEEEIYNGTCKQCGKEFKTIRKLLFAWRDIKTGDEYEFCSNKCKTEYSRSVMPCMHCGKSLVGTDYYDYRNWRTQFCNGECRAAYELEEAIRKGYKRTCENCGKEFIRKDGLFCCRECYLEALRGGWKPEEIKVQPKPKIIQRRERCFVCGKRSMVSYDYSMIDNLPERWYCSKKCYKGGR